MGTGDWPPLAPGLMFGTMIPLLLPLLLAQSPVTLARGRVVEGNLATGDTNRYAVSPGAGFLVYGEANQHTVDVVVTIIGPDGSQVAQFDDPSRGPEPFQFRTTQSGAYRILVTPFERETGRYDIVLRQIERAATGPAATVDQIMARFTGTDRAGASIAVARGGRVLFARGYGMANLEDSIPNTPATVFHIASVSKQFTAFAIAMLADQGRLSLDDDVRRHLPELHDFGRPITLRQLATHTSGLRDQWELWALAGGRLDDVIRQQDLLRLITRQRELNFAPGAEHLYSNTGYTLLAEVVARVSGRPFREWMAQNVFAPLGMTASQIYDDHERLVPRRAYSYAIGAGGPRKSVLSYANAGATSMFTTVNDLALWLRNWHTGQVGGARVIEMMQQRGVLTNGDTISYALGISIGTRHRRRMISHSGGDAGYRSFIAWYPELDAGVVVLGNAASLNAGQIAIQTLDAFFPPDTAGQPRPAPPPAPPAPPPAWQPDAAALAAFAGRYFSDELETQYTVVVQDTLLILRHRRHGDLTIRPARPDEFRANSFFAGTVRFERDAAGAITALRISGGRNRNILFRRT